MLVVRHVMRLNLYEKIDESKYKLEIIRKNYAKIISKEMWNPQYIYHRIENDAAISDLISDKANSYIFKTIPVRICVLKLHLRCFHIHTTNNIQHCGSNALWQNYQIIWKIVKILYD